MAATRFDTIAKLFARRKAVAGGNVSPAATPPASTWNGEKVPYLFVQSFEGGRIAPKPGEDGTYTLTLDHGLGQTLYFADRPSRDVGAVPTPQFLDGLGFSDSNPPNAALLVDDGNGETEIAVVELRNPAYDTATNTATYDVAVLEAWQDTTELGLQETPADLSDLPESFGPTHLFIDDCIDDNVYCWNGRTMVYDYGMMPFCYNYLLCIPCEPYGHVQPNRCATPVYWDQKCNRDFIDACAGNCRSRFIASDTLCN